MARPARYCSISSQAYGGRYESRSAVALPEAGAERVLPRSCVGGLPNVRRITVLNRFTLENPAASATSPIVIEVWSIRLRANWMRRCCATATGVAPRWRSNRRRRWREPTPSRSARSSTPPRSSAPSEMSRSARATVPDVPLQAGVPGAVSGRHRRHGRNPASSAAAAHGKNRTFSRFGVRAGQIGRQ